MTNSPVHPPPSAPVPRPPGSEAHAPAPAPASAPATALHYRQVVEQVITPNDYPRLTSLVRTLAPDSGSVRQLGDGLLWEQDSGYSSLALTINPEPDGTVIRADIRLEGRLFMYYFGAAGTSLLAGLTAASALGPLAGAGVGLGVLLPSAFAARALGRRSAERSMRQLRDLVGQLAAAIRGELG